MRRVITTWTAAVAALAFFAVGGWYMWHGNSPYVAPAPKIAESPTVRPSPSSGNLMVEAALVSRQRAAKGAVKVMLVGDSVAYELARALQGVRTNPKIAVFGAGDPGCNSLPGVTEDRSRRSDGTVFVRPTAPCDPPWEVRAMRAFDPDVVVWLASSPAQQLLQRGHWVSTCSAGYGRQFRSALGAAVRGLKSRGATVVITTSAYPRFRTADDDAATDCQNPWRRQVAQATGSKLVDLFSFICPGGTCRTKQGGVLLRLDGIHYTGPGARVVGEWILRQAHVIT